jgi:hypothetical protein
MPGALGNEDADRLHVCTAYCEFAMQLYIYAWHLKICEVIS